MPKKTPVFQKTPKNKESESFVDKKCIFDFDGFRVFTTFPTPKNNKTPKLPKNRQFLAKPTQKGSKSTVFDPFSTLW